MRLRLLAVVAGALAATMLPGLAPAQARLAAFDWQTRPLVPRDARVAAAVSCGNVGAPTYSLNVGDTATYALDAKANQLFHVSLVWGDGQVSDVSLTAGQTLDLTHVYTAAGTYGTEVRVDGNLSDGTPCASAPVTGTATVTATGVAPPPPPPPPPPSPTSPPPPATSPPPSAAPPPSQAPQSCSGTDPASWGKLSPTPRVVRPGEGISYTLETKGPATLRAIETFVRWRMPRQPEIVSPLFTDLPPDSQRALPTDPARTDDRGATLIAGKLVAAHFYPAPPPGVPSEDWDVTLTVRGVLAGRPCADNDFHLGTVRVVSAPLPPCPSCERPAESKCVRVLGRVTWWKAAKPEARDVKCQCRTSECRCRAQAIARGYFHTATLVVRRSGVRALGRARLVKYKKRRCSPRHPCRLRSRPRPG